MSVLICHFSDLHAAGSSDPSLAVLPQLADALIGLADGGVKGVVLAFGGDAVDKGGTDAFPAVSAAFVGLRARVREGTGVEPLLLVVPGNHDLDLGGDQEMRELALDSIAAGDAAVARPGGQKERAVLAPLDACFAFGGGLMADGAHSAERPYYTTVVYPCGGRRLRFHLFNTAWGCRPGAGANSLPFPVGEVRPPQDEGVDYQVALLHHPFGWFRQPEVMRPLREAVEARADLILTGHEHVARARRVRRSGAAPQRT